MRRSSGLVVEGSQVQYTSFGNRFPKENKREQWEASAAFKEMAGEFINGLPLLQEMPDRSLDVDPPWKVSEGKLFIYQLEELPKGIAAAFWGSDDDSEIRTFTVAGLYSPDEGPEFVDAILKEYYDGRRAAWREYRKAVKTANQSQHPKLFREYLYKRIFKIGESARKMHVLHQKCDANGRTIQALINKWLIEEGLCPAILPEGIIPFGRGRVLDTLVTHILAGMHLFIREVEKHRRDTSQS